MKIGYLGAGAWGFCLAKLLVENGHEVTLWAKNSTLIEDLKMGKNHPKLKNFKAPKGMQFTTDLLEAVQGADLVIESVTSKGIRPVLEALGDFDGPFIVTSKGIEQGTGLLMTEVAHEIMQSNRIGCLSGPSLAEEVMNKLPTSVVCSAYDMEITQMIQEAFTSPYFRVYPNEDMAGVSFGGAMKNIIAIACGISDGLGFGQNTKAALMTRGLHEIRKLGKVKGCQGETLNGLSGLGDLCVTCLSPLSRNYSFGISLSQGTEIAKAKEEIGMVVEGANTCLSARELAKEHKIAVPITDAVYNVIYKGLSPKDAVSALLTRAIKEERL
ncbi:MAG: Glycerol-3-phosphate dehydrogenase [NAD(P)+] [Chlamydiia bacterium]|nr:Glycerol-3-phosphate dehydrogenase [NAD(P)+] [Chlamydiia bacterium]MCH9616246.1 Glycerol-3-phosphate dehydrogenase [NAD(P)+] [Chlamydiia bacterium]MCH9629768.1 Glycerol-3-phosphate dehydrogenase [NAD(P)+] [Chlamydiia bacterium]